MKKIIYFVVLLAFPMMLAAQDVSKSMGDSAYAKGNYAEAISVYENLLENVGESSELHYNLGNAYYKAENIAKAILAYERALLLNPGDEDIAFNLELARSKTVDKVAPTYKFFIIEWIENIVNWASMQTWCIAGVIFFIMLLILSLAFLFGKSIIIRKVCFFSALVCLFITLFANFAALHLYHYLTERTDAIVLQPSVTAKSTPSNTGTDLFVIHEGRKVKISDDSMQGWKEIELEDGNIGWIPAESIEKI
jgi:tetratricopeptide (TPR) repeat protein